MTPEQIVFYMDLTFIVLLMVMMHRIAKLKGFGDFLGTFLICFVGYALVKAIPHSIMGGWTLPANPDPNIHVISGPIGFTACTALLYWLKCIKNRRERAKEPAHEL